MLDARDGAEDVGRRIKARLREAVGPRVTCSMGVAPSRWLAKVASAMDKPDGFTVLDALPGRLLALDLEDLPGVGARVRGTTLSPSPDSTTPRRGRTGPGAAAPGGHRHGVGAVGRAAEGAAGGKAISANVLDMVM